MNQAITGGQVGSPGLAAWRPNNPYDPSSGPKQAVAGNPLIPRLRPPRSSEATRPCQKTNWAENPDGPH